MIHLHADDFGYNREVDKKLVDLLKAGKVGSISVLSTMVTLEASRSLAKVLRIRPKVKIGLHLNLVEGTCASNPAQVPTLVDRRGRLHPLPIFYLRLILGLVNRDEIRRETRAQFRQLTNYGLPVSFVDSHQHTHALSLVSEVVGGLAKQKKITVRTYGAVKTFTFIGFAKRVILSVASRMASYAAYRRFVHPASWSKDKKVAFSFLSWEGRSLDILGISEQEVVFVAHPFLRFDSNLSYLKHLRSKTKKVQELK